MVILLQTLDDGYLLAFYVIWKQLISNLKPYILQKNYVSSGTFIKKLYHFIKKIEGVLV